MSYIIKNLDKTKYEPVLLNISDGEINAFFQQELGCNPIIDRRIRPFNGTNGVHPGIKLFIRNWVFFIPSIYRAYKQIKKIEPDIIHLNSTCLFAFAIAASFISPKPTVICHVRETIRTGPVGFPLRFFNSRFVDKFIAICNYGLQSLGKIPDKAEQKVIYNFVDKYYTKEENNNELKKEYGLSDDSVIFLYLARFGTGNGWNELIQMANRILSAEGNENLYFLLLGATDKSHYLQNIHPNIKIISFQKDADKFLKGSDVFVCPFVEPHFSRGIIEASAFSLPTIGANIGGVDESVVHGKTGFLYNSEEEFSKYVAELSRDKESRKMMGKEAYQFACDNFNMVNNLKETYNLYE